MRTAVDSTWARAAVLLVLLAAGTAFAVTADLPSVAVVRAWVDAAGPGAWAAMVLGLAVVLLAPVPRSAVSVLVGVVAGFWPGLALAFTGALLAGLGAFGLSRGLGRAAVTRLAGPRLARVDGLLVDRGFAAVLAARLLPMVPFVVTSYGAGLTAARPVPYALATAVGLVPSTVIQVGIGASAGLLAGRGAELTVGSVVLAVLVLGAWALLLARRRRRTVAPVPVLLSATS